MKKQKTSLDKETGDYPVYVIGDVHGCYYTLKSLMEKLDHSGRVIFVGDLCDRGLHTKKTIEFIIQNGYEVILGNHEDYMITHAIESLGGVDNRWARESYMGGKETLQSYGNDVETLHSHITWLKKLPRYIEEGHFFITHGFGLPYYKRRNTKAAHIGLLKNRITDKSEWGHDWEEGYEMYDIINIFGHTDYDEVEIGKNYYGIDTGCAYGNKLTAIELNSKKIISISTDQRDIS